MTDLVTVILSALSTGLAAGGQTAANESVRDAYTALKGLIQRKFAHSASLPDTDLALLSNYEKEPEIWEEQLHEFLVEIEAGHDKSVIIAAQQLLSLVEHYQPKAAQDAYYFHGPVTNPVIGRENRITFNNYDRTSQHPMRSTTAKVDESK